MDFEDLKIFVSLLPILKDARNYLKEHQEIGQMKRTISRALPSLDSVIIDIDRARDNGLALVEAVGNAKEPPTSKQTEMILRALTKSFNSLADLLDSADSFSIECRNLMREEGFMSIVKTHSEISFDIIQMFGKGHDKGTLDLDGLSTLVVAYPDKVGWKESPDTWPLEIVLNAQQAVEKASRLTFGNFRNKRIANSFVKSANRLSVASKKLKVSKSEKRQLVKNSPTWFKLISAMMDETQAEMRRRKI